MQKRGVSLDVITYTCMLIAYGRIRAVVKGKSIHVEGLVETDCIVGNAFFDMYSKCVG